MGLVGAEVVGLVISGFMSLIFGCLILFNQPRLGAARYFFLATLGISGWSFGIAAFLSMTSASASLPLVQVYYVSAALIAVGMLSAVLAVSGVARPRYVFGLIWSLFGVLAVSIVKAPEFMISGIIISYPNIVQLQPIGYMIYSAYFILLFIATITILVRHSRSTKRLAVRRQMNWLLYAYGPAGVMGATFNLVLPALGNYELIWVGPLSIVLFVPIAYLAISRHGLFDIRGAAVRTIAYVMTLTVLGLVYYGLAYAISALISQLGISSGDAPGPLSVAIALMLAFIFQPIKHFFDQLTNRVFYRGDYNREVFSREFGRILSYDNDLRLLLKEVSLHIANNFKAEQVFFYVEDRGVMGASGTKRSRMSDDDIRQITNYYRKHHESPEAIAMEGVESRDIERILQSYQVSIVLPLEVHRQIIGYVFIGEHKSRGYRARDIRVLESIANELAIAVQNSLSVEEVRELNESLQHRIDEATRELRLSNKQLQRLDEAKDEFISMASHQLRTPLTSIKGYLDMVLQGDLGKVTATQRAVLSEAFISSERMVTLINDFLNVSRLQTGKFTIERRESDLAEAMQEQLQMLEVVAKQHDLTLRSKIDKNLPKLAVDIDKIRQVMLNMIDNAIFYSKPGTTVNISLAKEGDVLAFRVRDTGIGVPVSEQPGLFSKFFRATNARKKRPDGTGVGLFLAKKVILAHGGQVLFESKEGKGSTFGFTVPLA